ncbi:MAG: hypothetical protein IPK50_18750 [Fibrobacterota bacterium]|nr:MAG: hypothetical protein IPK50_18750 [Fibrobacterota bacterium]
MDDVAKLAASLKNQLEGVWESHFREGNGAVFLGLTQNYSSVNAMKIIELHGLYGGGVKVRFMVAPNLDDEYMQQMAKYGQKLPQALFAVSLSEVAGNRGVYRSRVGMLNFLFKESYVDAIQDVIKNFWWFRQYDTMEKMFDVFKNDCEGYRRGGVY